MKDQLIRINVGIGLVAMLFVITELNAQTDTNQSKKSKQEQQKTQVSCKHPEIRAELLERMKEDQKARSEMMKMPARWDRTDPDSKKWNEIIAHASAVDKKNREWLKPLIEKHGWLGKSLVGKDGAMAAWLLVQHADADREFQKKCLALMQKMEKGEVTPINLGYLTDRVLAGEGKPQRYGTQVEMIDGKPRLKKVEDPENLDKRRAAIGLGPIDEYLKLFKKR